MTASKPAKKRKVSSPEVQVQTGGYIQILYLFEDGKTQPPRPGNVSFTPKMIAKCDDLSDVENLLKLRSSTLHHVNGGEITFASADQAKYITTIEEFKECFSRTNYTSPIQAIVPAPPSDSAKLPAVKEGFQLFVESARRSYEGWEKEFLKVEKYLFMEVKGDPFDKFSGAFLIWVRKCYVRLKDTLVKEAEDPGQRFILLGTAGIGKSFFTIIWVCYLATQKKRVVWKLDGLYYLLDFSQEVATVHGPVVETAHELVQVLRGTTLICENAMFGPEAHRSLISFRDLRTHGIHLLTEVRNGEETLALRQGQTSLAVARRGAIRGPKN